MLKKFFVVTDDKNPQTEGFHPRKKVEVFYSVSLCFLILGFTLFLDFALFWGEFFLFGLFCFVLFEFFLFVHFLYFFSLFLNCL